MKGFYLPPAVARAATFGTVEHVGWYIVGSLLVIVAGFLLFTYVNAKRN